MKRLSECDMMGSHIAYLALSDKKKEKLVALSVYCFHSKATNFKIKHLNLEYDFVKKLFTFFSES